MAKREDSEKIVINVGGVRHETYKSTLKTLPGTRLALLAESVSDEDPEAGSISEIFFDRDPGMFSYILNYYRTRSLCFPPNACGCLFEKELAFWGINETDMEPCCWVSYSSHREKIEVLCKLGPFFTDRQDRQTGPPSSCRSKTWALFDDPHSSIAAEVIAVISLVFLLVAIINTCVSTHHYVLESAIDYTREIHTEESAPLNMFFVVEAICVVWFTIEFLVHVVCCPAKLVFIKNPLNTVDFLAILPFYLELRPGVHHYGPSNGILGLLRAVRFLRLLQIFKMMQDVLCVQVLRHAVRASFRYLFVFPVSLVVASFMFGSLLLYAEGMLSSDIVIKNTSDGAWWALITLTTLGYGDMYPETWFGMIIGAMCALSGVMALALPVPALVNNFRIYYKLATAKRKLSIKKRCNPDLSFPVASSSRNLDHNFVCPLETESTH